MRPAGAQGRLMTTIDLTIDGQAVSAPPGATILTAAESLGIHIPTLCHAPELTPTGVCRVCLVEVEGARTLVAACHTPVAPGMVVRTQTPRVVKARKAVVELLLTAHTGACVTDLNAHNCLLHKLASDLEVGPPRFQVRKPRFYPPESDNPYVCRDLSKCILCRRCVRACREVAKQDVFSIGFRGFASKVVVGRDEPLTLEVCKDCGVCIDFCPTGALYAPARPAEKG